MIMNANIITIRGIALLWALPASAMEAVPSDTPPDASSVTVPNLNVAEKDLGDDRKYIVFHKAGVTPEQVEADLKFCWQFLPHGVSRIAPSFAPWGQVDANKKVTYDGGAYGLIGLGLASIVDGPIERSIRQSRLYNCMLPRGYQRYRTSEIIWNMLNNDAAPERSIRLQALIASGPIPPTQRMDP